MFDLLQIFVWKKWKNVLFLWKSNLACILIPNIFILFILYMMSNNTRPDSSQDFYANESDADMTLDTKYHQTPSQFFFTPNSSRYEFMTHVHHTTAHGYRNENELFKSEEYQKFNNNSWSGGFIVIGKNDSNPNVLNYVMGEMYSYSRRGPRIYATSKQRATSGRYQFEDISLQLEINKAYFENKTNATFPKMTLNRSPMTNVKNVYSNDIVLVFGWLFVSVLVIIVPTISVYSLVEEKQDGIKEILAIATTYSYLNEVTHFLYGFFVLFSTGFITLVACFYFRVFSGVLAIMPIMLVLVFIIALLGYSFFVSTFFDSVTFASSGGFILYIIPIALFGSLEQDSFLYKFKIFSPCSMFIEGMNVFINFMDAQRPFGWKHIAQADHPVEGGYSFLDVLLSELLCTFLYFFLYYYISNVFPGKNGTPRPFYFLFVPSFWIRKRVPTTQTPETFIESPTVSNSRASSVRVTGLSKKFRQFPICGKEFTAVDNISFNLPTNHITILLGHNGAGKTTTMQMITGIIPPTSGKIVVEGENDVARYRSSIGYCPQNDVFISYLNCHDHLIFFGCLRGLNFSEANLEANKLLNQVRLVDSAQHAAKTLSSGMKRRLCLACAVIGQTKLVILDEPSSGLDPESRRDLWDVLLPLRKERTVLLTTHSMEEADVLGDLIIIMDHGKIVCEGTQFELKRKYGSGYTLRILMTAEFLYEETMHEIQKQIPKAKVRSELYPTLAITLPYESMPEFRTVLAYLEDNKKRLGIDSISMSNTTMEDVFLNSAQDETDNVFASPSDEPNAEALAGGTEEIPQVQYLILKQIAAIAYKKCIFIRCSWIKFTIQVLLPIVAILIALQTSSISSTPSSSRLNTDEAFEMTAKHIPKPILILEVNSTTPITEKLTSIFQKIATEENAQAIILRKTPLFNYLLNMERTDTEKYYDKVIGGIQINGTDPEDLRFNLYFQGYVAYSDSYCIHLATNIMLKFYKNESYGIKMETKQILQSRPYSDEGKFTRSFFLEFFAFIFPFGFFFYILFYLNLPFMEENTEFRIIQKVHPLVYWPTYFVFDAVLHSILCCVYVILTALLDKSDAINGKKWNLYLLLCIVGYIYILIIYVMAKSFKKLSTIYQVMVYLLILSTTAAFIFSINTKHIQNYSLLYELCRLLPEFNLRHQLPRALELEIFTRNSNVYDPTRLYIATFIEAVLLILLIALVYENIYISTAIYEFLARINPKRWCCRNKKTTNLATAPKKEDQFVLAETAAVKSAYDNNQVHNFAVLVYKLKKNYIDFPAVKDISFSVEKGQCFGLLGMNGAGKSSVFKMMTLNASITDGDVFLHGRHTKLDKTKYSQLYGYCPEMHAHLDFMTAHEILKYMAWIKGKPFSELNREADLWLKKMDLWKYKHVKVGDYSGGTKRKLNTALAMISNPLVIFLDEPTTGVDPKSRRFMWNCIKEFQKNQNTVILTSHSMDECEELCNRLAIMSTGKFECIGYIPKLKEIFGKGFTLLIKVRANCLLEKIEAIKAGVHNMFECKLRDDYAGTLIYNILDKSFKWSAVFSKMEDFHVKHSDAIEDFAINETTLEDIFLQFRKDEHDLETV